MAAYFARHAWGNTTLQDLIDALAAASGRDLDAWRAGWLETAGTDRLTLDRDGRRLRPRRPRARRARRGRRCSRSAPTSATATRCARTALARVEVAGRAHAGGPAAEADLYLVNDDDLTFATARPDAATPRTPCSPTPRLLPTPLSRGGRGRHGVGHAGHRRGHRRGGGALPDRRAGARDLRTRSSSPTSDWPATSPSCGRPTPSAPALDGRRSPPPAGRWRRTRPAARWRCGPWPGPPPTSTRWRGCRRRPATTSTCSGGSWSARPSSAARPTARARCCSSATPTPRRGSGRSRVTRGPPRRRREGRGLAPARGRPDGAGRVRRTSSASPFWRPGQDELLAPYADRYLELLPGLHRGGMIPAMVVHAPAVPAVRDRRGLHRPGAAIRRGKPPRSSARP